MQRFPSAAWSSAVKDFIAKSMLTQAEHVSFLVKRSLLERSMRGFDLSAALNVPAEEPIRPVVIIYGSSVAGTAFCRGDADYAVAFPSRVPLPPAAIDCCGGNASVYFAGFNTICRESQPAVLTKLYESMKAQSGHESMQLQRIFRARIPIMQFTPHVGLAAPSGGPSHHFDISLSIDGCRNSLLLREYMRVHPHLRVATMILKHWARRVKLLNARRGWISPYALTIMLIHYFFESRLIPELLPLDIPNPILEKLSAANYANSVEDGTYGVEEFDKVLQLDMSESSFANIGGVLEGFFNYYGADDGFDFNIRVVDIRRNGRMLLRDDWLSSPDMERLDEKERWHRIGYGVMMIRDPYEEHSLGRSVEFFRGEAIRDECRKAAQGLDLGILKGAYVLQHVHRDA
jgi:hypothetical protein